MIISAYKRSSALAYFALAMLCMLFVPFLSKASTKFIPNKGQWASNILYRADLPSGAFFLEKNEVTYFFFDQDSLHQVWHNFKKSALVRTQTFKVQFVGSTGPTSVDNTGIPSEEYYNYIIGNDPSKWAGHVFATDGITMRNLWPGIDMVIQTSGDGVKYSFIVQPGADPSLIKLQYLGADSATVDESDTLMIHSPMVTIREQPPFAYQYTRGFLQKTASYAETSVQYAVLAPNLIGFDVENYRRRDTLTIDPIVVFSTFSGSKADNFGFTGTFNNSGNGYSGGTVYSGGFPTTAGAFQVNFQGGLTTYDAQGYLQEYGRDDGILKYSPDGKKLIWATYLGGKGNEQPHSMIVNHKGQLVIFGTTSSTDFPVTPTAYSTGNHGNGDIYITILDSTGAKLVASTYVGGGGSDGFNGDQPYNEPTGPLAFNYGDAYRGEVIVDSSDNVLVASCTQSVDLKPVNAFQSQFGGVQDGLVFKLSPDLSKVFWLSFLGGTDQDAAYGIHLDSKQNIFVCGGTQSSDFPVITGGISPTYNGAIDGFLTKISPDGQKVLASTYIGTIGYDQNYLVQTDGAEQVYVTGQTLGKFPVVGGVYSNSNGKQFIAQLDNNLTKITNSTVFGSGGKFPDLSPSAFLVDLCGRVYVSGWGGWANNIYNQANQGSTFNMPLSPDAFQSQTNGSNFYLIILSKNMTNLVYGTYFGGLEHGNEEHVDGGTSRFDRNGIVYQSVCGGCGGYQDFPTTPGAWSKTNNGIRAFDHTEAGCNNAMFKIDLNSANFAPRMTDTLILTQLGQTVDYHFSITDPQGDSVYAYASGNILDRKFVNPPAVFTADSGLGTIQGDLRWQTSCGTYSSDTMVVVVTARNNSCPVPRTIKHYIRVVMVKPPLPPVPDMFCIEHVDSNTVRIRWTQIPASKNLKDIKLVKIMPGGQDTVVATSPGTVAASYTDNQAYNNLTVNYGYFLYAESACGVGADTGRTAYTVPEKDSIPSAISIYSVSVENNKNIRVLWNKYVGSSFYRYFVYRKTNDPSSQYQIYAVVKDQNDTNMLDSNVDVQTTSYNYKILCEDQCGLVSPDGNYGLSIVLKGNAIPFENDLAWNPYLLWTNGVYKYDVYRRDPSKADSIVGSSSPGNTAFKDDSLNYDQGLYWYHVVARSSTDPKAAISVSNEIQLIQKPILYVPNVFTPNNDQRNDKWKVVPVFVKDYKMEVFNRWGEFIWSSDNKHGTWDGTYKNAPASNDVFIWQVSYTGWDLSQNFRQGFVTTLP